MTDQHSWHDDTPATDEQIDTIRRDLDGGPGVGGAAFSRHAVRKLLAAYDEVRLDRTVLKATNTALKAGRVAVRDIAADLDGGELLAVARAHHAAYMQSHSHPGAFACCSAHTSADNVPELLAEVVRLRAAVKADAAAYEAALLQIHADRDHWQQRSVEEWERAEGVAAKLTDAREANAMLRDGSKKLRAELDKCAGLNRSLVNEAADAETALAEVRERIDASYQWAIQLGPETRNHTIFTANSEAEARQLAETTVGRSPETYLIRRCNHTKHGWVTIETLDRKEAADGDA